MNSTKLSGVFIYLLFFLLGHPVYLKTKMKKSLTSSYCAIPRIIRDSRNNFSRLRSLATFKNLRAREAPLRPRVTFCPDTANKM